MQDEVAATRSQAVMYRESIHALKGLLLDDSSGGTAAAKVLLKGPTGTGKSVALAAIVEWARACGW